MALQVEAGDILTLLKAISDLESELQKQAPVIKAAEAWYQTAGNGAPVNLDEVLLHQAVEAYEAAKKQ